LNNNNHYEDALLKFKYLARHFHYLLHNPRFRVIIPLATVKLPKLVQVRWPAVRGSILLQPWFRVSTV